MHVVEGEYQNVQSVNPGVQFTNPDEYSDSEYGASGYMAPNVVNCDSNGYTVQDVADDIAEFYVDYAQTSVDHTHSQNGTQYACCDEIGYDATGGTVNIDYMDVGTWT